jgi:hypothetical protein
MGVPNEINFFAATCIVCMGLNLVIGIIVILWSPCRVGIQGYGMVWYGMVLLGPVPNKDFRNAARALGQCR